MVYKQQKFVAHCSGAWEVQDQGVGPFGSWWEPSSWLVDDCLLPVSSHGYQGSGGDEGRALVSSSSDKDTNPIAGAPPSWPHPNLITSWRLHLLKASHWTLRLQHVNFWGDTNIQSTTHTISCELKANLTAISPALSLSLSPFSLHSHPQLFINISLASCTSNQNQIILAWHPWHNIQNTLEDIAVCSKGRCPTFPDLKHNINYWDFAVPVSVCASPRLEL